MGAAGCRRVPQGAAGCRRVARGSRGAAQGCAKALPGSSEDELNVAVMPFVSRTS